MAEGLLVVVLPPRYLGSVEYYAAMAAANVAVIDINMRYDKRRKDVHRCTIAGTHGPLQLTVPVNTPHGLTDASGARRVLTWQDIPVSAHNHWWTLHQNALESAYGRCPYFEHYYPDIRAILDDRWVGQPVTLLDTALDALIRRQLGLTTRLSATIPLGQAVTPAQPSECIPTGHAVTPVRADIESIQVEPYRQLRQDTQGFMPHMSILDLLFNLGPNVLSHLSRT